jgi:hypothetical protein
VTRNGCDQIGKPDQIDRLIAACASLGLVGRVELLRSVRAGKIALVEPDRDAVVPLRLLERATRPLVALVGDDDYASTGPTAWPATRRLFRWARGAMIHATGADVPSYQMAIGMALLARRFLLVETDTAHAREWGEALLARRIPFITLRPPEGVHPVAPPRSAMQ